MPYQTQWYRGSTYSSGYNNGCGCPPSPGEWVSHYDTLTIPLNISYMPNGDALITSKISFSCSGMCDSSNYSITSVLLRSEIPAGGVEDVIYPTCIDAGNGWRRWYVTAAEITAGYKNITLAATVSHNGELLVGTNTAEIKRTVYKKDWDVIAGGVYLTIHADVSASVNSNPELVDMTARLTMTKTYTGESLPILLSPSATGGWLADAGFIMGETHITGTVAADGDALVHTAQIATPHITAGSGVMAQYFAEVEFATGEDRVVWNLFTVPATIDSDAPYDPDYPVVDPEPTYYSVIFSAGDGGTISPSGTLTFTQGSSTSVIVTPNEGYRISSVLIDGAEAISVDTPLSQLKAAMGWMLTINANGTVAARFAALLRIGIMDTNYAGIYPNTPPTTFTGRRGIRPNENESTD